MTHSRIRIALAVLFGAVLLVSVTALGYGAPGKGKPGKGKSPSAAQYQYGPAGHAYGKQKLTLCHKGKTLKVGAPAWKGHKKHGDKLGAC
jgi:hypothetical protein